MKNSYKKISAIVLAGVVVMGASLSSASAVSFRGQGEAASMSEFAKEEGIKILERKANKQEMDKAISKRLKKVKKSSQSGRRLLELLKKEAVKIEDMKEYEKLLSSGKQLHRVKVRDWEYLILFDEARVYGASRKPQHKFYSNKNQHNYDSVEFYGRKYNYNIEIVKDCSSYPLSVEFNAMIRSKFGHSKKVEEKLLRGPDISFENLDSLISNLKSSDNVFKKLDKGGYYRLRVGDLQYVIRKR